MNEMYTAKHLARSHYQVPLDEEKDVLEKLNERSDNDAVRLKRYLAMPDLTITPSSPLQAAVDIISAIPSFRQFDIIDTPKVISPEVVFDLFNFPKDHPARSASDTYYVDETHILRPHTSLMWKYYLELPEVKKQLEEHGSVGALSYGIVYRRDEIDWQHSNVLHHFDGLFVCSKGVKVIDQTDLENICREVTHALLGDDFDEKFLVDTFPYTDPSIEMDVLWDGKWVEVNGAGIVHPQVLENLGYDSKKYNGWAFGFGVDRLAMLKMRIPDIRLLRSTDERVTRQLEDINNVFEPVSKYPPVTRDISFIVDKESFDPNHYYEAIREIVGGDFVEEVALVDKYEDKERFGAGKLSYAFRIVYRHLDRTLTNEEVNEMHGKLESETHNKFNAEIR